MSKLQGMVVLACAVASCAEVARPWNSARDAAVDATHDVAPDADAPTPDAAMDVPQDRAEDAVTDGAPDAPDDIPDDLPNDIPGDIPGDTATDVVTDTATDVVTDTATDAGVDARDVDAATDAPADRPDALACPAGQTACGGRCVDLTRDVAHCGACGATCASGPCADGTCHRIVEIAAGSRHTCARSERGSVWCWGSNDYGQLGDGTMGSERHTPTRVPGLDDAAEIALGQVHSCARRATGTVWCWGNNGSGRLGSGMAETASPSPARVPGLSDIVQLTLGFNFTCARRTSGGVLCWGDNRTTQLGSGGSEPYRITPGPVSLPAVRAVEISAGGVHACALLEDDTVWCWGRNSDGELGVETYRGVPIPVPGLRGVVQLAMGMYHSCARSGSGTVWCWGNNLTGELGDDTTTSRYMPRAVLGLTDAREIASGG